MDELQKKPYYDLAERIIDHLDSVGAFTEGGGHQVLLERIELARSIIEETLTANAADFATDDIDCAEDEP
jgi:hypothetical protein